jgi:hypothetical protein
MAVSARVNIGFQGGQVLAMRVATDQLKALEKALGSTGWHQVQGDDGPVQIDLAQVVYVSSDSQESRVGFS